MCGLLIILIDLIRIVVSTVTINNGDLRHLIFYRFLSAIMIAPTVIVSLFLHISQDFSYLTRASLVLL